MQHQCLREEKQYLNLRGSYHKWLLGGMRWYQQRDWPNHKIQVLSRVIKLPDRHLQCPRKHVLTGSDVDRTFVASWSDTIGESSDLCG